MNSLYPMYDSTEPDRISVTSPAVAGYDDGRYAWPDAAWLLFSNARQLHISVLANPASEAFDIETGNASPEAVAAAVRVRVGLAKWSWVYTNLEWWPETASAFRNAGIAWRDRSEWPAPGPYLWPADWSGHLNDGTWTLPVEPVAIQTGGDGTVDWSDVYVELHAEPTPQPSIVLHSTKDEPMFIAHDSTEQYLILASGKVHVPTPTDGSSLTDPPPNGAGLPYVALSDGLVAAIPDAH